MDCWLVTGGTLPDGVQTVDNATIVPILSIQSILLVGGEIEPVVPALPMDAMLSWINPAIGVNGGSPMDGDRITTIDDQSGNSNYVEQITPSLRPAYIESGINGLPSINYDLSSFLAWFPFAFSSNECSFWIAFKRNGAAFSGYSNLILLSSPVGLSQFLQINDIGGNINMNAATGTLDKLLTSADTDPVIIGVVKTATNMEYFVDGVSIGTNNGAQGMGGTAHLLGAFGINAFNGLIGEVVIWDKALDASEITQTNTYFNDKFL